MNDFDAVFKEDTSRSRLRGLTSLLIYLYNCRI